MSTAPPLIPRDVLFGNPRRATPRLSPDARRMAYLAPEEGVLNVWLRTVGREDDRAITKDRGRGIRILFWAEDNRHVLYLQDRDGDENWHLYAVHLETNAVRDLIPHEGVRVEDVFTDPNHPGEILVAMNERDRQVFDLHRVSLETGKAKLEAQNPGNYVAWLTDHDFRVRGATAALPDGGFQLLVSRRPEASFEPFLTWGPEDNGSALAFTPDGQHLYVGDSLESDTTQLYTIDLETREKKFLSHNPDVDLGPVMIHPTKHHLQAVGYNLHRLEWEVLDGSVADDMAVLGRDHPGEISVVSRDHEDRNWLVAYTSDQDSVRYYVYRRDSQSAEYLFSNRPDLENYTLASMKPVTIPARDGLTLHSYLTLPEGTEAAGLPLVLNVHGGPWARDDWGYDPEAQWLANRGYAVLQVNYRGSVGFGKAFLNAGNREWGAKMHDDLLDSVDWAVGQGIADAGKICIYGGSYGGYAALVGAAFTPDVFCCAVDIVGPSNIITLIESIPPYWAPLMDNFRIRVGDIETEKDFLEARSPLFKADSIRIPMLIAQGANDPRVKQAESEQIVEALRAKGKDVDYLLYPDEGHGFARPENRMAFYAAAEEFLARRLGGRFQPAGADEERLLQTLRK